VEPGEYEDVLVLQLSFSGELQGGMAAQQTVMFPVRIAVTTEIQNPFEGLTALELLQQFAERWGDEIESLKALQTASEFQSAYRSRRLRLTNEETTLLLAINRVGLIVPDSINAPAPTTPPEELSIEAAKELLSELLISVNRKDVSPGAPPRVREIGALLSTNPALTFEVVRSVLTMPLQDPMAFQRSSLLALVDYVPGIETEASRYAQTALLDSNLGLSNGSFRAMSTPTKNVYCTALYRMYMATYPSLKEALIFTNRLLEKIPELEAKSLILSHFLEYHPGIFSEYIAQLPAVMVDSTASANGGVP
jgi:hypothetical protein